MKTRNSTIGMNRLSLIYSLHGGAYVGSIRAGQEDVRLSQHRAGQCRTTKKMAARHGVDLATIEMNVLYVYDTRITPGLEGEIMNEHKADGMGRWNAPYCLSSEDSRRAHKLYPEMARNNGRSQGRKNVESGRLAALGRIQGRKNVESGQLASIASSGGLTGGPRTAARPGHMAAIGRIGGRLAVESGQLASIRGKGGHMGGLIAMHNRWHTKRGIHNPECSLCRDEAARAAIEK